LLLLLFPALLLPAAADAASIVSATTATPAAVSQPFDSWQTLVLLPQLQPGGSGEGNSDGSGCRCRGVLLQRQQQLTSHSHITSHSKCLP